MFWLEKPVWPWPDRPEWVLQPCPHVKYSLHTCTIWPCGMYMCTNSHALVLLSSLVHVTSWPVVQQHRSVHCWVCSRWNELCLSVFMADTHYNCMLPSPSLSTCPLTGAHLTSCDLPSPSGMNTAPPPSAPPTSTEGAPTSPSHHSAPVLTSRRRPAGPLTSEPRSSKRGRSGKGGGGGQR